MLIVSVSIVVVPLTAKALLEPDITTSSLLLFPKTALPVTVKAKSLLSVPVVVTVDPSKVLSAPLKVTFPL